MSKKLKYYIIHCTATEAGQDVKGEDVKRWHTSPKPIGRGWKQVGYRNIIWLDGTDEQLVPVNYDNIVDPWEITNGVKGYNSEAMHTVYAGGLLNGKSHDTRTDKQKRTMYLNVMQMLVAFPDILIGGHNQLDAKDCPCFDVPTQLREWGVPEKNILKV